MLIKNGNIVGLGINKDRNIPAQLDPIHIRKHSSIHSEVSALISCSDPRGATLYVARWGKRNRPENSYPCDNCAAAIIEAGVKRVVYTDGVVTES